MVLVLLFLELVMSLAAFVIFAGDKGNFYHGPVATSLGLFFHLSRLLLHYADYQFSWFSLFVPIR